MKYQPQARGIQTKWLPDMIQDEETSYKGVVDDQLQVIFPGNARPCWVRLDHGSNKKGTGTVLQVRSGMSLKIGDRVAFKGGNDGRYAKFTHKLRQRNQLAAMKKEVAESLTQALVGNQIPTLNGRLAIL